MIEVIILDEDMLGKIFCQWYLFGFFVCPTENDKRKTFCLSTTKYKESDMYANYHL